MRDFQTVEHQLIPPVHVMVDLSDGTRREAVVDFAHIGIPVHVDGYEVRRITNKSVVPIRVDVQSNYQLGVDDWEVETSDNLVAYLEEDESALVNISPGRTARLAVTANPAQLSLTWSEEERATRRKEAIEIGLRDEWEHLAYLVLTNAGVKTEVVEASDQRTPDLTVQIGDYHVPVEVKTFKPNDDEKAQKQAAAEGRSESVSGEIGLRAIKALRRARGQIAEAAKKGSPTIVVLLDPSNLGHGWPDEIAAALEGQMTAEIDTSTGQAVVVNVERHENKRRASYDKLQEISAVGVISTCPTKHPTWGTTAGEEQTVATRVAVNLTIYHNPHASLPLSEAWVKKHGFAQERVGEGEPRQVYARLIG